MKNQKKRRNSFSLNRMFLKLILVSSLFMGIGYASVNSVLLGIGGSIEADLQDGIYITDVSYDSSISVDYNSSKIINAYQTLLKSSILLSKTDPNSSITYKVTIYNSNDNRFAFDEVSYFLNEDTYDNQDITFKLNGLEYGDILDSKDSVTFTITFYYKDNILSDNNILNSVLNFKFEYITQPLLTKNMVPVVYENENWKKIDNSSPEWHNYLKGKWANAVTYNHGLVYNEVINDTELKQFNGTSDGYILGRKNYDFGTNMTLMARFKIYEYGSATQIAIGNVETSGFYLGIGNNNKIRFRHNDTSDETATTNQNLYSSEVIELDTWYTAVVTYDGSYLKLYVNGVLEDVVEYSNVISKSEAPLAIGGNPSATGVVNGSYFKGAISEVAIMTEVISANDIAQFYGNTPNHIPTKFQTLYYVKFDADNGIVANSAKYESDGMSFDGINDHVSVGYSDYDFNNSVTIGSRFKLDKFSSEEYTVFGNPQQAGINIFKTIDNTFQFAIYDEKTAQYYYYDYSVVPEINKWYTLIATYDGAKVKLYVNGQEDLVVDLVAEMVETTTPFMIGVNPNTNSKLGGAYFSGTISDAILIDEALTSEQINTYYSSDLRTIISDKTLISYDFREYESRDDGTVIPEEMISTMLVWIPRFSAINPTSMMIDATIVEPTKEAHDAFNFSDKEIDGFWIGKFENSSNVTYENTNLNINVNSNILIKPNNNSIRNKSIGYMFDNINNITSLTDIYGFNKSTYDILDTHLIKNNEWGAVAYFAQSKYGLCNGGVCKDLYANNTNYITGSSNYLSNINQSTSYNITGVYDLSGGADEFTMGNYNNALNSLDGFSTLPNSIYTNIYTTEENYSLKKLQHAVFETNTIFNNSTSNFVTIDKPWLIRNNLFSYNSSSGENSGSIGSRTVLVIK